MHSSSILNVFLIVGLLGVTLDASASLISCSKPKLKVIDPVSDCEQLPVVTQYFFNAPSGSPPNPNSLWDFKESFLTKDDLVDSQFTVGSLTDNELTSLCLSDGNCNKSGASLISYYARGAIIRVSEPAPLFLVILGILGLGLVRRQLR